MRAFVDAAIVSTVCLRYLPFYAHCYMPPLRLDHALLLPARYRYIVLPDSRVFVCRLNTFTCLPHAPPYCTVTLHTHAARSLPHTFVCPPPFTCAHALRLSLPFTFMPLLPPPPAALRRSVARLPYVLLRCSRLYVRYTFPCSFVVTLLIVVAITVVCDHAVLLFIYVAVTGIRCTFAGTLPLMLAHIPNFRRYRRYHVRSFVTIVVGAFVAT